MTDDDRNVLKTIVTGFESWCFMYDPETKFQSATWLGSKKRKAQKNENSKIVGEKKCCLRFFFILKIIFIMN
jgi:hypothetical protein